MVKLQDKRMDVENTHFKHYGMVTNIALSNTLPIALALTAF